MASSVGLALGRAVGDCVASSVGLAVATAVGDIVAGIRVGAGMMSF